MSLNLSRFDYLFYEFHFMIGPDGGPRKEFFFLPERVLPDVFYNTEALEEDFSQEEFQEYRIHMDRDGGWIRDIWDIMRRNPKPRCRYPRPVRVKPTTSTSPLNPKSTSPSESPESIIDKSHGRHDSSQSMIRKHRQFFYNIMRQCARRYVSVCPGDSSLIGSPTGCRASS